jgi:hypothetical protein
MARPLFEFGDFAVYADEDGLSFEEIGEDIDGDTWFQDLPADQIETLRDVLTFWLANE